MNTVKKQAIDQDRFIITGALHGVTPEAVTYLREFEAMGGRLDLLEDQHLALLQFDGVCNADCESRMIEALQRAGAHCTSHGIICHGKDHCEPLNLHLGPMPQDHPHRLASAAKHIGRWLHLRRA
jgi:hypothetical protein